MKTYQVYMPSAQMYYIEPKAGSHAYRLTPFASNATQFSSVETANEAIESIGFHISTMADDGFAAYVSEVVV